MRSCWQTSAAAECWYGWPKLLARSRRRRWWIHSTPQYSVQGALDPTLTVPRSILPKLQSKGTLPCTEYSFDNLIKRLLNIGDRERPDSRRCRCSWRASCVVIGNGIPNNIACDFDTDMVALIRISIARSSRDARARASFIGVRT